MNRAYQNLYTQAGDKKCNHHLKKTNNYKQMGKLFFILLIFISIQTIAQDGKMKNLQSIIDEVKNEFAPDKRVALFDIKIVEKNNTIKLKGETTELDAKAKLLSKINDLGIAVEDSIKTLPCKKLGDKIYGLINNSVGNIRSLPKHSAELATQALLGTPVKVFKKKDGFYLIQAPDKYISWIDSDGLKRITHEEYENWVKADKMIYQVEYGFSYSAPDENSERVSDLVIGDILEISGDSKDFLKVKYPDGRIAFVKKDETANFNDWLNITYPTRENIIATAKLFIGNPYLWGGTSAKGLDCSGFSKTVYFLNGVVLARDASQQVNTGILVDTKNGFENIKMGDLLFFGPPKKDRITHVGIYISDNEFIHESGRVRFNSFDKTASNFSKFRFKGFKKSKDIIDSIGKNGIELVKNNIFYNGKLK